MAAVFSDISYQAVESVAWGVEVDGPVRLVRYGLIVDVTPGAPAKFEVEAPETSIAGQSFGRMVTVLDAF